MPGWGASELPAPHPLERVLIERGRCVGHPDAANWTASVERGNAKEYTAAKAECRKCPVMYECRTVADHIEENGPQAGLDYRYFSGVRGAEGPTDRAKRRLERNLRAA